MRVLPYGEHAMLAELDDPHLVPALLAAVQRDHRIVEAVPGARTLLVEFDPARADAGQIERLLSCTPVVEHESSDAEHVELRVRYDGADLATVAERVGLTPAEVVELHAAGRYTVRFCGFAPGFGYLDGLHPMLHVPRHAQPRTSVPAGSVAIAGEFTGVYPRSSPGGWQLLGRTDAPLWDAERTRPALLQPGTTVTFVPR